MFHTVEGHVTTQLFIPCFWICLSNQILIIPYDHVPCRSMHFTLLLQTTYVYIHAPVINIIVEICMYICLVFHEYEAQTLLPIKWVAFLFEVGSQEKKKASVKTTHCVFKLWAHSYWPAVKTPEVKQHWEVTDIYCNSMGPLVRVYSQHHDWWCLIFSAAFHLPWPGSSGMQQVQHDRRNSSSTHIFCKCK